jgi:coproporphyrinogen III oxidase-like Fe-S oxidoreductase
LPPLSLYIHLPWCLKKCPYCDFNSHEMGASDAAGALPEQRTWNALRADLEASAAADLGPHGAQCVHWRWHAQPVFARRD